ncbi:Fanconi anemia group J protein homolog isoform X2 [Leptopilina boulardi]|uniref:Fanconi anemia group J protein homolog isoform X2 n=1 Tax=Leptopilina boulardi TaxID=63433 RepID=UPI0021F5C6CF|nr:Fanconi anemia group J protein homolog isoform X2 [Leptopilina boulardi]
MISWIAALIVTLSFYIIIKHYKNGKMDNDEFLSESEEEKIEYGKRKGNFDWEAFKSKPKSEFKKKIFDNSTQSLSDGFIELTDDESDKSDRSSTIRGTDIKFEAPRVLIHNILTIAKVSVDMPVKPYPCQTAVMNMLIKGCTNKQNCLLESPTGSGKTLALLCSALAWQDNFAKEVAKEEENRITSPNIDSPSKIKSEPGCSNDITKESDLDFEDGFINLNKALDDMAPRTKIPKIYYGSRTHKQIEQIIKELKRTAYRDKAMTILSSREHSCIQNPVKKSKTQLCNELLDPVKKLGCPYYTDKNRIDMGSNVRLRNLGINGPWDVEDLVELGKEINCCPYFSARHLMLEAEIIFCPYNYIIDPQIRETMQLDLKDQIIILDEAHNIEDICRDVASKTIRADEIEEVIKECMNLEKIVHDDILKSTYNTIYDYCQTVLQFLAKQLVAPINGGDESCSAYWKGDELMQLLEINSLGRPMLNLFINAAKKVIIEYNNAKENIREQQKKAPPIIISLFTKRLLEDLLFVIEKISSIRFSKDFKACIMECEVRDYKTTVEDDVWVRGSNRPIKKRIRMLKLLCMYPGVIFKPLSDLARSIILASGTLAPINSFQSELGTTFPNMLQANHVIPSDQVYVRGIAHGPTGIGLKANYQNTNLFNFKDELGRLLVQVCQSVPHGVLCFFSSYKMMNSQIERWKDTLIWQQLENSKHILVEPRYGNELDEVMTEFRTVIKDTSNPNKFGVTGALLFAVFRGKVAEGIDFSDNEARCVLTVGIPFAVRKDPAIDMKMMYNDLNKTKGLLSGGDWYSIQAFRALNQALGRCIRHKNDWGAVLVVDERFVSTATVSNLPKWVKSMWRKPARVNLPGELKEFVQVQKIQEEERLHL